MATLAKLNGTDIANIGKINGTAVASLAKWNGLDLVAPPTSFDVTIETTTSPQTFSINIASASEVGVDIDVDWGDGSSVENFTSQGIAGHSFATAGTYIVKISGTARQLNLYGGTPGLVTALGPFAGIYMGYTNLNSAFRDCTQLTTLPDDFFSYCAASGTTLEGALLAFRGCGLTSIPATLFDPLVSTLTSVLGCFQNCGSIGSIPATLFDLFDGKIANVTSLFANNTSLTGQPYKFWDWTTPPTSTDNCYINCTGLTDYATIPAAYK